MRPLRSTTTDRAVCQYYAISPRQIDPREIGADQRGIIENHTDTIEEAIGLSLFGQRDTDDLQAVGLAITLQSDEFGDFAATGNTPARPEIDHQHPTVPFRDIAQPSTLVGKAKIRALQANDVVAGLDLRHHLARTTRATAALKQRGSDCKAQQGENQEAQQARIAHPARPRAS